jgi:hypothetical protein
MQIVFLQQLNLTEYQQLNLKTSVPYRLGEKYIKPIKSLQEQLAQHSVLRRNSQLEAQIGLKMSRYGFQMAILK